VKVKDLIKLLSEINPEADVIIKREVESVGYGTCDSIRVGIFAETDYGNDFFPGEEVLVRPGEVKAVCFIAKEDPIEKINK
jgi:hypothetical protein